MPVYNFKCSDCQEEFEVTCRMNERTQQHCPACNSSNYEHHFTTPPPLGDPVRLGVRTIDGGFREVLSRIGSANYKSDLSAKLSRK